MLFTSKSIIKVARIFFMASKKLSGSQDFKLLINNGAKTRQTYFICMCILNHLMHGLIQCGDNFL